MPLLARMLAHHGYEAVAPSPEETERLVREVPRAIIRRLQETMGQTQGDPDDPAGHRAAFTRSPREAVAHLTRAVEESVQRGLDEVAGQLRTPGAGMFSTGSRK